MEMDGVGIPGWHGSPREGREIAERSLFLAQGALQQQENVPTGLWKGCQPLLELKTMVKHAFHRFSNCVSGCESKAGPTLSFGTHTAK